MNWGYRYAPDVRTNDDAKTCLRLFTHTVSSPHPAALRASLPPCPAHLNTEELDSGEGRQIALDGLQLGVGGALGRRGGAVLVAWGAAG